MPKCSYCGKMYEFPRGLTFVKVDGSIKHLCSSKCRKNMFMKRRKVRWITKRNANKETIKEIKEEVEEERKEKSI